jgi:hypothetical protein
MAKKFAMAHQGICVTVPAGAFIDESLYESDARVTVNAQENQDDVSVSYKLATCNLFAARGMYLQPGSKHLGV